MKKFITVIIFALNIVVNLYAITLYTPNGKSFQTTDAGRAVYDYSWFEAWRVNLFGQGHPYPNSWVVGYWEDGLWEYNCHVFAWNNWQGANR